MRILSRRLGERWESRRPIPRRSGLTWIESRAALPRRLGVLVNTVGCENWQGVLKVGHSCVGPRPPSMAVKSAALTGLRKGRLEFTSGG